MITAVVLPLTMIARNENDTISYENSMKFLYEEDIFYMREFYEYPNLGTRFNKIKCDAIISTDLKSKKKSGYLCFETHNNQFFRGVLDYDEISKCISFLNLIKENVLSTSPSVYTETDYNTNHGLRIGAYWEKEEKKWIIYIRTREYFDNSIAKIGMDRLDGLIKTLTEAKQLIDSKL